MTTITWINPSSGLWTTASNWSPAQVPGAADDAFVTQSGAYLISINTAVTVNSLTLNDASGQISSASTFTVNNGLVIDSGELQLTSGTLTANGLFNAGTIIDSGALIVIEGSYDTGSLNRISGTGGGALDLQGTLANAGGTLDGAGYGFFIASLGTIEGGTVINLDYARASTLDGVTWDALLVNDGGAPLVIRNGLTLNAADGSSPGLLANTNGTVEFQGNQIFTHATIDGTGTVLVDNTLTLGATGIFVLQDMPGPLLPPLAVTGAGTVDNFGTVEVIGVPYSKVDVGRFAAISVADFENAGTVQAIGGPGANIDSIVQITSPIFTNLATGIIDAIGGQVSIAATTAFTNNGMVIADSGTVTVNALLSGSGMVTLLDGGTVDLGSAVVASETIDFQGPGLLQLDQAPFVAGTITNFANGDTIDLTGLHETVQNYVNNTLTLVGDRTLELNLPGPFSTASFVTAPDSTGNGTDITLVCFAAGTSILTEHGEVPVEKLAVGDTVVTLTGAAKPITWIGVGQVLATRGRRNAATPVIVRKGALGDNQPNRDLRVTKGHSFLLDGVLIPVEFLVNHRSIMWDDRAQEVSIYHIELATHDVLLANGAPAESYRDDGNRWLFRNANHGWYEPPKPPYAPVLTGGAIVDAIWRRLLDRAGPRPGLPLTDDPDLHLLVDGARVNAVSRRGNRQMFRLSSPAREVRIVSRAAVPAELGLARDPRLLGIALQRIELARGKRRRVIEASDARLTEGFHDYEPADALRWTNGDAVLPPALFEGFDGGMELSLRICGRTCYVAEGARQQVA